MLYQMMDCEQETLIAPVLQDPIAESDDNSLDDDWIGAND